ncbi:hypothetical protein DB313_01030 [Borrelia turcica IST7]|uniref:DUF3139 domain-containing protein n=1 Tax=Borrelia turcica IST7 TaxID=1104446 RepID=A0A386PMC2_9SPIR|nr:hypothetical protein [Borrelia turcica]AYE36093.1 hypothetical protein DB313_01030 [Borrelia turcica IST7]
MNIYKKKKISKYSIVITLVILATLSIFVFLNLNILMPSSSESINKKVKNLFLIEITKHKGKSPNDYTIESYYSIFKDIQGNEIATNDKDFSKRIVRVDALIHYYYREDKINTKMHLAFVSYDIKTNRIKLIHSE